MVKKLVTMLLAICIMMCAGMTAFADGEVVAYADEAVATGYRTIEKSNELLATERLLQAFDNLQTQVDLTDCEIAAEDFTSMYFSILYDHPEYFYIELSYRYSYNVATKMITVVSINYLSSYRTDNGFDWAAISADRVTFDAAVAKAMAAVSDEMSDLEKVLAFHEYLGSSVIYDYDDMVVNTLPDSAYTAYGALVNGSAVCQGYSLAMELLCSLNHIESMYVSSAECNHGWNMIRLDGEWYHLDLTYDDPVYTCSGRYLKYSVLNHSFFLVGSESINDGEHNNFARPTNITTAAPSASDTMDGIWVGQKSQMLYRDGYWYYVSGGDIVKSKIDGSDLSVVIKNAGLDIRLTSNGTSILYSTRNGVYAANYDGSNVQELYVSESNRIHGLHYENGAVYVEIHNPTGGEPTVECVPFEEVNTPVLPESPKEEDSDNAIVGGSNVDSKDEENDQDFDTNYEDKLDHMFFVVSVGDLDNDGQITVSDLLALKNLVMTGGATETELAYADCDGDGVLSVTDIVKLKSIVMGA